MHDQWTSVALSAGLGAITGMRSISGLALLSRRLSRHRHYPPSVLSSQWTSRVLTTLAAGELAADKTPVVPDRTSAMSVAGRAVVGAVAGVAASDLAGGFRWVGALAGASSAITSTYLFFYLRKAMTERLGVPDWMPAMAEDALVLFAGSRISMKLTTDRT